MATPSAEGLTAKIAVLECKREALEAQLASVTDKDRELAIRAQITAISAEITSYNQRLGPVAPARSPKYFRIRRLEREGVAFADGGVIPEEILRLKVRDEADFNRQIDKGSLEYLTLRDSKERVAFDDIVSEPLDVWRSDENILYDGHLDFGRLSSKYASDGVKGYHDALEAQSGEALHLSMPRFLRQHALAVANHGLYYEAHRYQIWMRTPFDPPTPTPSKYGRERDGLLIGRESLWLLSVKSRFTETCITELLRDIGVPRSDRGIISPAHAFVAPTEVFLRSESNKMITLHDYMQKQMKMRPPRRLPFHGLAVSPLFAPGLAFPTAIERLHLIQRLIRRH